MGDGGAGAAGTELHDVAQRGGCKLAAECFGKAAPIRVVSARSPVREYDGIDRVQRASVCAQLVEQTNDSALAGVRDVETIEAHARGGAQEIGQVGEREA